MGLDTTHGAWNGSYGNFMHWRQEVALAAGLPPLRLMEGFYGINPNFVYGLEAHPDIVAALPISWDLFKNDPLHILLSHSDCDGEISPLHCKEIADRLEEINPKISGEICGNKEWAQDRTRQFIRGLRVAWAAGENVEFL